MTQATAPDLTLPVSVRQTVHLADQCVWALLDHGDLQRIRTVSEARDLLAQGGWSGRLLAVPSDSDSLSETLSWTPGLVDRHVVDASRVEGHATGDRATFWLERLADGHTLRPHECDDAAMALVGDDATDAARAHVSKLLGSIPATHAAAVPVATAACDLLNDDELDLLCSDLRDLPAAWALPPADPETLRAPLARVLAPYDQTLRRRLLTDLFAANSLPGHDRAVGRLLRHRPDLAEVYTASDEHLHQRQVAFASDDPALHDRLSQSPVATVRLAVAMRSSSEHVLRRLSYDPVSDVRQRAAARTCGDGHRHSPADVTDDLSPVDRREAARWSEDVATLRALADDPDAQTAASAAGRLDDTTRTTRFLAHPDPVVRAAAAEHTTDTQALWQLASDHSREVAGVLLRRAHRSACVDGPALAAELARRGPSWVRRAAATLVSDATVAGELANDPDPLVSAPAVATLVNHAAAAGTPTSETFSPELLHLAAGTGLVGVDGLELLSLHPDTSVREQAQTQLRTARAVARARGEEDGSPDDLSALLDLPHAEKELLLQQTESCEAAEVLAGDPAVDVAENAAVIAGYLPRSLEDAVRDVDEILQAHPHLRPAAPQRWRDLPDASHRQWARPSFLSEVDGVALGGGLRLQVVATAAELGKGTCPQCTPGSTTYTQLVDSAGAVTATFRLTIRGEVTEPRPDDLPDWLPRHVERVTRAAARRHGCHQQLSASSESPRHLW